MEWFNIQNPIYAYIFGLLQTDGHLREMTQNRSQITLELSQKDADIIYKIQKLLPIKSTVITRTRNTNFKQNYSTISLRICNLEFKNHIKKLGLPAGRKSEIIQEPNNVSKVDYYRGVIDGDGSLGITNKGLPFISFVTSSEMLAKSYIQFIKDTCGFQKLANRNKRDNVFNLMVCRENCQTIVKALYYPGCISLDRKQNAAEEVLSWERPSYMEKYKPIQRWTDEEIQCIMNNPLEISCKLLNRTENNIKQKLQKIKQASLKFANSRDYML